MKRKFTGKILGFEGENCIYGEGNRGRWQIILKDKSVFEKMVIGDIIEVIIRKKEK